MSSRQKSAPVTDAKKTQVSKKKETVVAAVEKAAAVVSTPAPAPVPAVVVAAAPAPVAPKITVSAKVPAPVAAPAPATKVAVAVKVAETAAPAPAAEVEGEKIPVPVKEKRVRARPRNRAFDELYTEMNAELQTAYKSLQNVARSFRSLASAHEREVSNKIHREATTRTPTTLFDKPLVDYFLARLSHDDLQITRKQGDETVKVDLSGLTENTPVFRTDLTKLYSAVFKKHNLTKEEDRRDILYSKDPELVALLTTGAYAPELEEQVEQIRPGTLALNIFKIQRFLNHHLSKVVRAEGEAEEVAEEEAPAA